MIRTNVRDATWIDEGIYMRAYIHQDKEPGTAVWWEWRHHHVSLSIKASISKWWKVVPSSLPSLGFIPSDHAYYSQGKTKDRSRWDKSK